MAAQFRPQYWLINARSGNGAGERLRLALQGTAGVTAEPIRFDNLSEQLKAVPPEALLVVAGGDGTFSSVFGMSEAKGREVACVPLGTANDLAREFGISRRLRGARYESYPSILAQLEFRRCAVWTAMADRREVPFINYLSIGYEGAVVRDFTAWRSRTAFRSRLANRIAYTLFGIKHSFVRLHNLILTDGSGQSLACPKTTGIIITNIQSHLGMAISNGEREPGDETIESISVSNVLGFARMIVACLGIPLGLSPYTKGETIALRNIPPETPIQIDGETAPPIRNGELTVKFRHFVRIASA